MYSTSLKTEDFLRITYRLMIRKINRIKEINGTSRRGKLPLPSLKEKYEETSKILQAVQELIKSLDFDNPDTSEIADLLNIIGLKISKANISEISDSEIYYDSAIAILEVFLDE